MRYWLATSYFVSPGKYQSLMQYTVLHTQSHRNNSGVLMDHSPVLAFHTGTASAVLWGLNIIGHEHMWLGPICISLIKQAIRVYRSTLILN